MTKTELDTKPDTNTAADNGFEPFNMPEIPGVNWYTDEEARKIFDEQARKLVGISGEEFLRRYDAGEFDDIPDDWEHMNLTRLEMLIPFGR